MSEDKPVSTGHPYDDWMEKIRKASNAKPIEEPIIKEHHEAQKETNPKKRSLILMIAIAIFFISLAVRLYFIFFITNPQNAGVGWYNDSYHHWQIAYLTKEIGLGKGFLRLWDLIGMEYFWGLLHPLILVTLFTLTGTADIIVVRLFNALLGSITTVVLFFIIKKHFSWQAALGAALLAIVNPIGIFTDTSGMQEPLAILLMLLGVYFWPERPLRTGLVWMFASLTRAEYWLFSMGLIIVIMLFDKAHHKKALLIFPYIGGILLYMKYLLDKTGNAIYPIYWNFLGNAAGKWEADIPLTSDQEAIKYIFLAILIVSIIVAVYLIHKRPKLYHFSLLGVGNFIFLAVFVGFTQYLKSYLPRFWVDRIFWLPYMWLGATLAIFSLYLLPKYVPRVGRLFGWIIVIGAAVLLQYTWQPINSYRRTGDVFLMREDEKAAQIASFYKEGSILIPGNDPIITYQLYKNGIQGSTIRGEMFDPYFYFTETDPYMNWGKHRKVVLKWFKDENIKLLVFTSDEERYVKLVKKESGVFTELSTVNSLNIYRVNL
jgi:hypothetical protein